MKVRAAQRQVVTEWMAGHLLANAPPRISLYRLGAMAEVSECNLLYYIRDRAEAMGEAMGNVAVHLGKRLEAALLAASAALDTSLVNWP